MHLFKWALLTLLGLSLVWTVVMPTERIALVSLIALALFGLTLVRPAIKDVLSARKQSQLLPPAARKQYMRLTYLINISTVGMVGTCVAFVIGFIWGVGQ